MSPAPRPGRLAGRAWLAVLAACSPAAAAPEAGCATAPPREEVLAAVGPRGELVMASGTRAVLSGLHWPDDAALAREAEGRLLRSRGRALALAQRGSQDRWGRVHVDASPADGSPGDLAAGLVAEGLAQADAGEDDALCRSDLLALEEAPRADRRGVWAAPVLDARDGAGLAAIAGDFVIVQGRVLSVGERGRRSYLNFAPRGGSGLTVTVPKRTWRIMQDHGLTAAGLKGRLVRARGRVEIWRGPVLDIASPEMIEVLEGERAPRR